MSLTTEEIKQLTFQLNPLISGGTIVRIDQPEASTIVFHIRNDGGLFWLQFVTRSPFVRMHLKTKRPQTGGAKTGFCNVLRQHLTGSPLVMMTHAAGDRVVALHCIKRDALLRKQRLRFIAELTGRGANLVLIDSANKVLGVLYPKKLSRREVKAGLLYEPPPPPPDSPKAETNRFLSLYDPDDVLSLSRAISNYYRQEQEKVKFEQLLSLLKNRLHGELSRQERLALNIKKDIEIAENADDLRKKGELLKIALPDIKKGQNKIVIPDYFVEGMPEKTIEMNPRLSPQENMQKFFKRYKNLRKNIQPMRSRLQNVEKKINELEIIIDSLNNIRGLRQLEVFIEENDLQCWVDANNATATREKGRRQNSGPRQFTSAAGDEIYVARNSKENRELTFSFARGNDWWMHILGSSGPHVIIKTTSSDIPSEKTLNDAAHLAVYYSKRRGAGFARVIYTQRKYVKPVKGGEPGTVHYAKESTFAVRYSEKTVKAILQRMQK